MYDTAQARAEGETDLVVTRDFAAPPEVLFKALTDPEIMTKWMLGPPGWTLEIEQLEWQVGGRYAWRFTEEASGTWFGFSGEVLAYDPPHSFTVTQAFDPGTTGQSMGAQMRITQSVSPADRGARLQVVMHFASAADREAAMSTGMAEGMEMSYARLDGAVAQ